MAFAFVGDSTMINCLVIIFLPNIKSIARHI